MKRNTLFGGFSLLVAGAAIGAGAVASGSAMAGDGTPPADEGTIEVVTASVGADGTTDAFSCSIDGVDLGVASVEWAEAEMLPITANGDVQIVDAGEGVFEVSGATGVVGISELPDGVPADALPVELSYIDASGMNVVNVVSVEDVREGTEEECATVRADFEEINAP